MAEQMAKVARPENLLQGLRYSSEALVTKVLPLRIQGKLTSEIAAELDLDEPVVRRVLGMPEVKLALQEALAEVRDLTTLRLVPLAPQSVQAMGEMIADPTCPDRFKASKDVLDRLGVGPGKGGTSVAVQVNLMPRGPGSLSALDERIMETEGHDETEELKR